MTNIRDLVKPIDKTWIWTPTLRDKFQKAKEEIVRRVKNDMKTYNILKKTCLSRD